MNRTATSTMTRERPWALTAISVILFILLCWIFDDGLLAPPLWNGEQWISSRLLTGSIYYALIWLPMRFFLGRDWFSHGAEKVVDPAWMNGGEALRSFWEEAIVVPEQGRPPIAYAWFRDFLQYMLDNGWYSWFAKLVAWGEVVVGLGLLVGALVGLSAFLGTFMNFNYMLAGSASTNPVLFGLAIFLVLAWKVAGHWGLDRWLLPALGSQWARAEAQVDAVATRAEQGAFT